MVRIQDPARQARVLPRQRAELQVRAHHGGEQPRTNDVLALRAQIHRVRASEQVLVIQPATRQLRGQRGRRPRVHDVQLAHEAAGHAALILRVTLRNVRRRINRQSGLRGGDDVVVVNLAVRVHAVPQRERHTEEALTGDQPVTLQALHPVLVAHAHEVGVELQLAAAADEFLVQILARGRVRPRAATVTDVPLARGDDLEGLVALLKEVGLTHRLGRLALQLTRLAQGGHHGLARGERRLTGDLLESRAARIGRDPLGGLGDDAAVLAQDRAQRQLQVTPPVDVGRVAEGTAHGDARALVHLGLGVGQDRHLDAVHGGCDRRAEQRLVALVVRVGDQGDAGGQQLGTRRLDAHVHAVLDGRAGGGSLRGGLGVGDVEGQAVVEARVLAALQLSLGDRRLEGDVPQARGLGLVGLAARQVAQERGLGDLARTRADCLVVLLPVHAQAQVAPQRLELSLIFDGEALAQLHEVLTGNRLLVASLDRLAVAAHVRGLEVGVVGQRGIYAHAEVVLHAALGGQAVVVPTHRVEHGLTHHALVAGHDVSVRVGENMADVKGAGYRRRGSVDRVHLLARRVAVKGVGALAFPGLTPLGFEAFGCGAVGHARRLRTGVHGHN